MGRNLPDINSSGGSIKRSVGNSLSCTDIGSVSYTHLDEVFENFIKAIAELKAKVGIKRTIKEYGVTEEDFMATLDEMVENAFNDQCTGANPRYPLMKEIREIYLKAYYEG